MITDPTTADESSLRLELCVLADQQTRLRAQLATLGQERAALEAELARRTALAERCTSRGPAPTHWQCGDYAGHTGFHTALIPTGAVWFPRTEG